MNVGYAILAMGELSAAENNARRHTNGVAQANYEHVQNLHAQHDRFVFATKSQVHGLRANLHGHLVTEDHLIAALKAENANHPLASREAVEADHENERVKALRNPEVIKRTYKDGVLPHGAIIPPDLVMQAVPLLP